MKTVTSGNASRTTRNASAYDASDDVSRGVGNAAIGSSTDTVALTPHPSCRSQSRSSCRLAIFLATSAPQRLGGRPRTTKIRLVRSAEVSLPGQPRSASSARRFLTERLTEWDLRQFV